MRLSEIQTYYHGTNSDPFTEFDDKYTGGIGFHFTKHHDRAKTFGKRIMSAILDMKNTASPELWKEALDKAYGGNPRKMAVDWLKKQGYDSVETPYETIVFDANQIHIISEV
jgi:hypothetical protein